VSNGYTSECSEPYWSNPPFSNFFDIRALWRSGLSVRVLKCQKNWKRWVRPYGAESFGRLVFATSEKVWN